MTSRIHHYLITIAVQTLALLALAGCGGGGTSSEGGIGGSGISMGITQDQDQTSGKQKVTVNGVDFNTNNATFTNEGDSNATQNDIQLGMVVAVTGTINPDGLTGTADTVSYEDILEGPVQSKTTNSLMVMGQTVIVDGLTKYNGTDFASLQKDDVIEVSGFFTANNAVYATYIEKTNSTTHEILGIAKNIDPVTFDFDIGALRVINMNNNNNFANDDLVRAEGVFDTPTGKLNASSVDKFSRNLEVADADDAEIEGLVSSACSNNMQPPCSFTLGFITVQVNSNTQFEGGLLADVQPGAHIEVEGSLNNNILLAEEIEFEDNIDLITNVVGTSINTLTLEYGNTDVIVTYDNLITQIEGTYNVFSDINTGDHVQIRARKTGANTILATKIVDKPGSNELMLQGLTDGATSNPNLVILGISVNTNIAGFQFIVPPNETSLSQDQFFNLLQTGTVAKLTGTISPQNLISWEKAEIE